MNTKSLMNTSALALVLMLASPAISPAGAVAVEGTSDCTDGTNMCVITLVADGSAGTWDLEVSDGLTCDTTSTSGSLSGGESLVFLVTCEPVLEVVDGKTCWGVAAETETQDRAEASADMQCNGLSADCSSSTGAGEYDYCWDDDYGTGNAPVECELSADATWWDAGSYARAACYVGYDD